MTDPVPGAPNLTVIRPSRRAPRAGDIFAMRLPDGRHLFGRVMSTEAHAGPSMVGATLVYVYDSVSDDAGDVPPPARLGPRHLLVFPMMTNHQPWRRGYFTTVTHRPIEDDDMLEVHCFRRWDGRYFDEHLQELPGPVEPVGEYGLHSHRTIDDEISDAMGIPRAP